MSWSLSFLNHKIIRWVEPVTCKPPKWPHWRSPLSWFWNFILSCEGKGSGEDRPRGTSFTAHSSSCHSVQFPFHSYFPICAYIPLKLGEYLPGDIISLIPPLEGGWLQAGGAVQVWLTEFENNIRSWVPASQTGRTRWLLLFFLLLCPPFCPHEAQRLCFQYLVLCLLAWW